MPVTPESESQGRFGFSLLMANRYLKYSLAKTELLDHPIPHKQDTCCFPRLPYSLNTPIYSLSSQTCESSLISLFSSSPTFIPSVSSVVSMPRIYPPPPITLVQDSAISCVVHCHSLLTSLSASTSVILSSCPLGPFLTQQQE